MKSALYIGILLFVALMSSCDGDDRTLIGNPQEIVFSANHVSRALTQTDIDNGVATVKVYGVQNNTTEIFNNVNIYRDAETGKWFPTTKRNWVEGSNYSFHGYAYNTTEGLTITNGTDGIEISVQQPVKYDGAVFIDYLLSHSFKVTDGAMKPIVQLHLEHAMTLVDIYVVRGNMFEARLKSLTLENIYSSGNMKCTEQAIANSGGKNIWDITPSGSRDAVYTYAPTPAVSIGDDRENTGARMSIMCLPQQLTANTTLTIVYEVNEKVTVESADNYVEHTEKFQLYNYNPMNYQPGHHIVYTATVDSGVNLEGTVVEWKDVDYIEGTVLPEIK
ncbi:MAG: fimbrillin family protein [Alistipes sp.]|nr:fimbrillin family protein [Alistipes sp.]